MYRYLLGITVAAAFVGSAEAAISSGNVTTANRSFLKIAPPPAVGNDNQQDTTHLLAFDERQNHTLTVPLTLNITSSGVGNVIVPAGTVVSSHYVFYDPAGGASIEGTVTFTDPVLGIIEVDGDLDASAAEVGAPGTAYNSPSLLGLESGDTVSVTGLNQITFDVTAGSPGDYVRVITVPEPASAALLAPVVGLMMRRGRR